MRKDQKRKDLSKAEIAAQLAHQAKIEHNIQIARTVFPIAADMMSVYDAQTVFNAVSGHLQNGIILAQQKLKVSDLEIDLETGKDSLVKRAVVGIIETLKDEPAQNAQELLDLMGRKLPEFLANKHMKDPMSEVPLEEFIAK